MGCIANIIYGILQFCALVFAVLGTPFDQFRLKKSGDTDPAFSDYFGNNFCITLWGSKEKCYQGTILASPKEMFSDCSGRATRFKAAQVCAIILIAASLAALLLSAIQSCCCGCLKWLGILLNVIALIAGCIAWGMMLHAFLTSAGESSKTPNPCGKLKDFTEDLDPSMKGMMIGAGFILLVIASGINLLNIFIILLPC